jgi:uracil-DNA glycosylase
MGESINIAFIGSNPSHLSKDNQAFSIETKSRKTLEKWIEEAGLFTGEYHLTLHNVSDIKTENNRPLTVNEIHDNSHKLRLKFFSYKKVVALGKTAHKALSLAGIPHLEMPHPSGMNRKLNDPNYVKECIDKLREYAK